FYSPIPDTRELGKDLGRFDIAHPMYGVDMREDEQWRLVETLVKSYEKEYAGAGEGRFGFDDREMLSYAPFNALTLYALIRHHKPARMIEVGSGTSTRVSAAAFVANRREGKPGELIAIEPYPSEDLKKGFEGL